MTEQRPIPVSFLILCFCGPLVLLLWPVYEQFEEGRKRNVREGTAVFILFTLLLLVLRLMTGIPILGILFQTLLILVWLSYVIAIIWLIAEKHANPHLDLPFLSTYVDRLGGN